MKNDPRSYYRNFYNCVKKPEKNSGLEFFFRLLYAIVKIAIITARITLHLISYPQFTYDLFHMHNSNDILFSMNKQHVSILVLLDLSAACDTVDHAILLGRLETSFGITDAALAWFASHLSGRSQCVLVNGERSDGYPLPFGVFLRIRASGPYSSVPMPASCSRSPNCTCPTPTHFIFPSTQTTPLVKQRQ